MTHDTSHHIPALVEALEATEGVVLLLLAIALSLCIQRVITLVESGSPEATVNARTRWRGEIAIDQQTSHMT